jgi:hypothetical protein
LGCSIMTIDSLVEKPRFHFGKPSKACPTELG